MAGDFKDLLLAMESLPGIIEKGCEDGLRKSGGIVVGTAKKKLGTYQPAVGEYPAWAPLKAATIRAKFRSKGKKGLTPAGKKYFKRHGGFQPSGTGDDDPLIGTGQGHLRAGITMDDSDVFSGIVYIGVAGKGGKGSPADYAAAHEFGSAKKNIPPRPYLRPSVYENKEEIEKVIKSSIIEAMTGFR